MVVMWVKIVLDVMGGDYVFEEIVIGVIWVSQELDVDIFFVGDCQVIEDCLNCYFYQGINFIIVDVEGVVEMEEDVVVVCCKFKVFINVVMNLVKEK